MQSNENSTIEQRIQAEIDNGKPVLIKVGANWCNPCKMISPVFKKMKDELKDEITLIEVDVDEESKFCAKYSIRAVPSFIWCDSLKTNVKAALTTKAKIEEFIAEMRK